MKKKSSLIPFHSFSRVLWCAAILAIWGVSTCLAGSSSLFSPAPAQYASGNEASPKTTQNATATASNDRADHLKTPPFTRTSSQATLRQVRLISSTATTTNPFDAREVKNDIQTAQAPATGTAIALTPSFTGYHMVLPGSSLYLQMEESGATNKVGDFVAAPTAASAVRIVNRFDFDGLLTSAADFFAAPGWSMINQSPTNIVAAPSVAMVVKRSSDNTFFRVSIDFVASASGIDFFSLSGYNCGGSAANCP